MSKITISIVAFLEKSLAVGSLQLGFISPYRSSTPFGSSTISKGLAKLRTARFSPRRLGYGDFSHAYIS